MADGLEVIIWDVQHGSAALVLTPTGKRIAIDLGVGSFKNPHDITFSPLQYLYDEYDYRYLDALIITHPHTDHLDDIVTLSLVPPSILLAPRSIDRDLIRKGNQSKDKSVIDSYFQWIDRYSAPVDTGKRMDNSTEWGCDIRWFFPVYDGPNLNNYSIVTVISYAGSTVVIPGDNEAPSWKSLLEQPRFVSAIKNTNVFVASHHGRESGYSSDLFKEFKPKLVIVSDTDNIPTSATNSYYSQATGMNVFNRETEKDELRYVVTTRSDDYIHFKCWTERDYYSGANKNWIQARIN